MLNKIIYIGGRGKLANFLRSNTNYTISSRDAKDPYYFDLYDLENSKLLSLKNHTIVFGAAISSPDFCQNNAKSCTEINYDLTKNAISKLLEFNKVIFLSSDLVYSGNNHDEDLNENVIPKPVGLYEKLKYKVELEFSSNSLFYIIRLSFVEFRDNSFFSYLDYCFNNFEIPQIIHPLIRHTTQPNEIMKTIEKYHFGVINYPIINLSGSKKSRIDLLNQWEKISGNKIDYKLVPIESSELKHKPKYINFKSLYL